MKDEDLLEPEDLEPTGDPHTWMRERGYGGVRGGTVWHVHRDGFYDHGNGSLDDAAKRCQKHYRTTREYQLEQRVAKLEAVIEQHLVACGPCEDTDEDTDDHHCQNESCTYCGLIKAAGSTEACKLPGGRNP